MSTTKVMLEAWVFCRNEFNSAEAGPRDDAIGSIVDDDGNYIAEIWSDYEAITEADERIGLLPRGTAEKRARLMAAAPELLAALKEARAEFEREYPTSSREAGNWPTVTPFLKRLDAAIAKAEGAQ